MIRHVVMWKFRPGTEAEQRQFLEGLRALQGVIPQLLRSEVAVNMGTGNYDAVLVSGSIGCHGAAVMMARSGLLRENSPLRSDCQPLHRISAAAMDAAADGRPV